MKLPGVPDGPDPPDGAGAAGGYLGGGASIRSSSDGQDEAIDTPNTVLRSPNPKLLPLVVVMYKQLINK